MVMICPAIWWGWTPPMTHVRFTAEPWENLRMFIIPSLILGTYLAALRQSELDLQGTFDGVHVLASQDAQPLGQPVLGSRRDLIRHGLLSPAANMHHCLARKHSASN